MSHESFKPLNPTVLHHGLHRHSLVKAVHGPLKRHRHQIAANLEPACVLPVLGEPSIVEMMPLGI